MYTLISPSRATKWLWGLREMAALVRPARHSQATASAGDRQSSDIAFYVLGHTHWGMMRTAPLGCRLFAVAPERVADTPAGSSSARVSRLQQ